MDPETLVLVRPETKVTKEPCGMAEAAVNCMDWPAVGGAQTATVWTTWMLLTATGVAAFTPTASGATRSANSAGDGGAAVNDGAEACAIRGVIFGVAVADGATDPPGGQFVTAVREGNALKGNVGLLGGHETINAEATVKMPFALMGYGSMT